MSYYSQRIPLYEQPKLQKIIKEHIPEEHRDLFSDVAFSAEGRTPLFGAARLPGKLLQINPSIPDESLPISVIHEYGHQVWDFVLTDEQRKEFRDVWKVQQEFHDKKFHEENPNYSGPKSGIFSDYRWYMGKKFVSDSPDEEFAEIYAYHFSGRDDLKERLNKEAPELYDLAKSYF